MRELISFLVKCHSQLGPLCGGSNATQSVYNTRVDREMSPRNADARVTSTPGPSLDVSSDAADLERIRAISRVARCWPRLHSRPAFSSSRLSLASSFLSSSPISSELFALPPLLSPIFLTFRRSPPRPANFSQRFAFRLSFQGSRCFDFFFARPIGFFDDSNAVPLNGIFIFGFRRVSVVTLGF